MKKLILSFLGVLFLLSCNSFDASQSQVLHYPSQIQWKQVSPGIQMAVVHEGTGEVLTKGSLVEVHYVGWYTDQIEFYHSVRLKKLYRFKLGRGRVIPAWDTTLLGLKRGSQIYVRSDHRHAFGDGRADGLRSFVDVVFGIHILD